MTTKKNKPPPPSSTLGDIILSNFDLHQKRGQDATAGKTRRQTVTGADAEARAARIREQVEAHLLNGALSSMSVGDGGPNAPEAFEEAREEVTAAVIQCLDGALATVASGKEKAGKAAAGADGWKESVERVLDLVGALGCGAGDGYLARAMIERAAQFADVASENVRIQVCNFLGVCAGYLQRIEETGETRCGKADAVSFLTGSSSEEDEDWKEKCSELISAILIPRLTDKSQAVRASAIRACGSFFLDGTSEGERFEAVTDALLVRLAHDSSFANRCAAVQSVPVTEDTIPHVIERVRDVKEKVRVEALEVLQRKVDVHDLTEEQRVDVLRSGLTERCTATYEAAAGMVCSGWMKSTKFDPIALIRLLDPVNNDTVCEGVVRAVFAAARDDGSKSSLMHLSNPEVRAFREGVFEPISVERTDDEEPLDPGTVHYLRIVCDTAINSKNVTASEQADILGKFLPDVPVLCEVLQKHLGRLIGSIRSSEPDEEDDEEAADFEDGECFVCMQLLQLAKCADLQEEGSRRHLVAILHGMLCSAETPDDLIEGCVRAMATAHDSESQFLQTVSEIVSDIGDNMKDESAPDEDASILRQIRTVSILSIVLENVSGSTSSVLGSFSDYIVPAVTSNNTLVREAGVSCLGKFALLMEEDRVIDEFKPLLIQVASRNEEKIEVRAQALLALCDLALLFDRILTPSPSIDADNEDDLSFVFLLSEMLCHSKSAVVVVAAEIAAKLLFADKLHDHPSMVAHLLVIFFDKELSDPSKSDDVGEEVKEIGNPIRLQQILSVFFPAYSLKSKQGRQTMLDSIRPLLTIVNEKQTIKVKGRKAKSWPIASMIEYVCSTVDLGVEQEADNAASRNEDVENEPIEEGDGDGDETIIEASSTLTATVAITEVLAEQSANMTTTYLRALCKMAGCMVTHIDVQRDDPKKLSVLKKSMEDHLAMVITDDRAIRSLEPLHEVLEEIESEVESSEGEEEEEEEERQEEKEEEDDLVDAMAGADLSDKEQESMPEEADDDAEGEVEESEAEMSEDESASESEDSDDGYVPKENSVIVGDIPKGGMSPKPGRRRRLVDATNR